MIWSSILFLLFSKTPVTEHSVTRQAYILMCGLCMLIYLSAIKVSTKSFIDKFNVATVI